MNKSRSKDILIEFVLEALQENIIDIHDQQMFLIMPEVSAVIELCFVGTHKLKSGYMKKFIECLDEAYQYMNEDDKKYFNKLKKRVEPWGL